MGIEGMGRFLFFGFLTYVFDLIFFAEICVLGQCMIERWDMIYDEMTR
jgi:hypothetical protein